jgi:outer membrane protein TolC
VRKQLIIRLGLLLLISNAALAQQKPAKLPAPTTTPVSTPTTTSTPSSNFNYNNDAKPAEFEDYLVQLALKNNPSYESLTNQVTVKKEEIQLARKDWTRNLTSAINFNESNYPYFLVNYLGQKTFLGSQIDLAKIPSVVSYPLWNIGVGVNFGDLIVRKHKVKIAEEKVKIAEFDILDNKSKIKAEVLARYQTYLSTIEVLKIRLQSLDAAESSKNQLASLFAVNKVKFEDYSKANKDYFDALENKLKGDTEVKLAKIKLETILGVKWDTVEKVKTTYDDKKNKQ